MPTGGQVVGGQAGISQSGAAMRIDQSSARAAIDWQSFNIGAGASVTFNQPSSSAIALNRVLGSSGSEIYGRLSANGQVFLINPNGVLFGRGAQVDVGGLVASTLGMSADDFMLGRYSLRGSAAGSVVNQGTIRAPDGSVALIAPNVTNDGLIEAQHGAIALTAASAATVDFLADGLVRIRVDDGALQAEIANNGVLRADGGTITLTAKSLDNLARAVVNNTGIIEARTVEDVNGVVRLAGGDVYVSGTIDVSSADGVGGSAHVLGERVALLGNARIDASGALGGGEVLIGGDRGGRNPEIQNAAHVHIGADATVRADALTEGHGGTVIAWSDEVTRVYGNLSVRGGAGGGDGGFVETSSKRYLDVQQAPDLRAPAGRAGTWLLDPETINIENAADFNITAAPIFQPALLALTSTLNINTLNLALNQGGTVIVDTTDTLLGLGVGDINVNAPITKTSGSNSTLQLLAHNDININQNITSSNNALNLVLNANQDGTGGIVNIANNVTLNTAGGTINASAETVNIGTATIVAPLFSAGTLNLSPGTLTLTGNVDVSGALNWSGGVMTGAGTTLVRGPLAINASVGLDAGRVLDVQGGANWTAGNISLNPTAAVGSGVIVNRAGSIFSTNSDGSVVTQSFGANDNGSSARFDNLGTFRKMAGSVSAGTTIATAFNNTGTVDVRAGKLTLQQNGTHAGTFSIATGAKLDFAGGVHALTSAATLSSQGHLLVSGGVVNTNGLLTSAGVLELSGGTLNAGAALNTATYLQSGGTLGGSGDVTVAGAATLSGGTMTGTGRTITQGALAITGPIALDAGRVLDVGGDATWTAGSINLNPTSATGSGSIVNRSGSKFSTNFDGLMLTQNFGPGDDGTSALFENLGTFQKTGGMGTSAIANAFNNIGALDVQSGTVWLQQGGTHAGSFTGAGTLQFGGGAHVLTGTSSVTVANATFSAGTTDVGGTYNIAGTTTVNGGTASFTGTLASLGDALDITSGVADLRGANATVATFTQSGGTLSGTSSLTVSGATTLSGGSMSGPGSTITQGPLAITGSIALDAGRVLDVQGGATWTAGSINLNSTSATGSGMIVNRAASTFSMSFDGTMFTQNFGTTDNGASAVFDNLGTFQKTGGTGTSAFAIDFNNTGALNVQSGTVNLQQGGAHAGSFGGAGTIEFSGGTHALDSTSVVPIANAKFSGGSVDIAGTYDVSGTTTVSAGTANFAAAAKTSSLIQTGGTLSGTGTLTVGASTVLSGGTMSGPGTTITHGSVAINGSISLDAGRVLDIHGDADWTAGSINLNGSSAPGSGTIINRGTFTTNGAGSMFTQNFGTGDNGASALFENRGTFLSTGSGTTSIQNVFHNRATLDVRSGTVSLQGGGTHGGTFAIAAGATLQFSGGTHDVNDPSALSSTGRLLVTGGSLNINAALANGGLLEVSGGALNVAAAMSTASYKQSAGTLSGAGSLTVSGAATLSGGTMTGAGSTITQGPLAINGSIALDAGRVLDVQGGATWTAGSINLNATGAVGTGTIINRAGSTFTTSFDGSMFSQNFGGADNGSSALFDNLGTFQKSAGTGTTTVQNAFSNGGTLSIDAGTLSLTAFPSNAGAITVSNSASLALSASLTNMASGVISGNGTIDLGSFTLTNDGTISAGATIGTLNIVGNLVMGATGVVHTDVRDPWTSAGGDFDLINVSGSAALGGTLRLDHVDALAPAEGQLMQVINAGTVSGAFASVAAPSGSTYRVLYNPADATVRHEFTVTTPVSPVTVSGSIGFDPSTVGTTPVPSVESDVTQVAASEAPLVAFSVKPAFVLPDLSHIMASMSELRRKKVDAVEDAVRILERNPNAADLPLCVGEPSGNCIAERRARLEPGEGAPGAAPELAHLWGIERKFALLIGVNEYRDPIPQLGSPLKDIAEIAALYRTQFGYDVRTLPNADKASIVREINRLILETGPNDSVVVFYAGHGHVVEKTGRGYWIPGKAGGDDPKQWISNSDIAKMLANIPARQVLLVSDSCYSGTLAREGKIEKSEVLSDPRAVLQRRAVTVLTSGGEEPVADAGKDGHSVFAWHFLRTLGRVAQWSSGVDVYERLAETVQLDFPQTPQYGAALGAGHEVGADYLFEVRRY